MTDISTKNDKFKKLNIPKKSKTDIKIQFYLPLDTGKKINEIGEAKIEYRFPKEVLIKAIDDFYNVIFPTDLNQMNISFDRKEVK